MQQTSPKPKALTHAMQLIRTFSLSFFLWLPLTLWAENVKIEAENATLNGVDIVTTIPGYSGSGYVWNFDNAGDKVTFNFSATEGLYGLTIHYTSPYGEKGYDLQVNASSSSAVFAGTGDSFASVKAGEFQLTEGQNTITISQGWGYYGIDYIELSPVSPPAIIKLEGENAALTGVAVSTDQAGYSGTGYVWGFDEATDNIVFSFPATAGLYELTIIYYSPFGEKGYGLQVNSVSGEQKFTGTGDGFGASKVGQFQLTDGQNTVKITSGWGWYGIDYITLTPVTDKPVVIVPLVNGRAEAESAELDGVIVATAPEGFSGTGYVWEFDNATDKVTINFNTTAGLYDLSIGYTSPYGEKGFDIQVNEEKASGMFASTASGNAFGVAGAGKFLLKEGLNTVTITRGWGYFGIDYIELTPTTAPLPVKPPKQLADASATASTRALFSYMIDLYGNKVLSGQYDDVDYVLEKTGKEPAIGGFDLMEYSPSRIQYGANPAGLSEKYIEWAKKGAGNGIITLTWHWNAPKDLINEEPDKLWWSGFYTRATTFDLAAALADKNSERYQLLIRDMDAIAVELKKFQEADVPVLWRPLHEAAGGWFWWGAKGAEPFKELWHILYERLTNHHGLHNLIWVYTATPDMNWYPGDNYVDMVGLDIYTDATANMSGDWDAMQNLFSGKKMVSLSESGNLPDPTKIRGFATWWSWFAVWSGDFIKNQPLELLQAVYNDEDIITRDELPDWRVYSKPTISLRVPADQGNFLICEVPTLQAEAADTGGTVKKITFFADGQLIGTDTQAQDGWQLVWTHASAGAHTLTAEAIDNEGNTATSAPVSITIQADIQPPVITVAAYKTILWLPTYQLYSFHVDDFVKKVADNCGTVSDVKIRQVSSDEPVTAFHGGKEYRDIMISPDCKSVQLRAKRSGKGNGRVYRIEVVATDQYGNTGTAFYEVQVPVYPWRPARADAFAYTVQGKCSATNAHRESFAASDSPEIEVTDEIVIYPNPANGSNLTVTVYASVAQQAVFSLIGTSASHEVMNIQENLQAGVNHVQLPIDKITSGVYMLIVQKDHQRISKKVVIVR